MVRKVLIGFGLLLVIAAVVGHQNRGGTATSNQGHETSARPAAQQATAAPARQYIDEPCDKVADMFSANSKLTDLQKDKLWGESYAGRWVRWTVGVNTVEKDALGDGYTMQFKCSAKSLVLDGHADLGANQGDRLLKVGKDDLVKIEGRLDDHGDLIGLEIKDATLVP